MVLPLQTLFLKVIPKFYNYSKHAPWLIQKVDKNTTWLDLARMVRVGHGVNKTVVLAYNNYWISFDWIKP